MKGPLLKTWAPVAVECPDEAWGPEEVCCPECPDEMAKRWHDVVSPTVLGTETGAKLPEGDEERGMAGVQALRAPAAAAFGRVATVVMQLRCVLALAALGTLQGGLAGPSVQFITTSSFSHAHGIDCEDHPKSPPCRQGAAELAFYTGMSNSLSHSVAWLVALTLGSCSDAVGRRPFFRLKAILQLLPAIALGLHVFGGLNLWGYLVLAPVNYAFDNLSVFLACMNDLVKEPELRSTSFASLIGSGIVFGGLVLPLGALLPQGPAIAGSVLMSALQVVYVYTYFPETLPSSLERKAALPGFCSILKQGVAVFTRNGFIMRMVCVLVLSGFSTAGMATVVPSYTMAYLGFNRKLGMSYAVVCGASIAVTLALGLLVLLPRLGDVGTMKLSLLFAVLYPLALPFCSDLVSFFLLGALCVGPMVLLFPVISSIKSNVVGEDEQGIVQGALAAVRGLAVAVSDPLFGWLYRYSTDNGAEESRLSALPSILLIAAMALLAFALACTLPQQPPQPGSTKRQATATRPEEREDVELTSMEACSTPAEEASAPTQWVAGTGGL